jgi:hypothetical protein
LKIISSFCSDSVIISSICPKSSNGIQSILDELEFGFGSPKMELKILIVIQINGDFAKLSFLV